MRPDGWVGYIKIEDYHDDPDTISKTGMWDLLDKSPAHSLSPKEETEPMLFGDPFHVGVLERKRFLKNYVVYPADCLIGSGKGQRGRKEAFDAQAKALGQTVIKPDWMDQINAMREAVLMHPDVKELKLLEDGESELSGYFRDPEFENVATRVRLDYINKETRLISDLKSTTDAREFKFKDTSYKLGYHLQAAHYLYTTTQLTGIVHDEFYFIVVERPKLKGAHVGVIVYKADEEVINEGLLARSRALTIHLECMKTGVYPSYPTGVRELGLPGWIKRKDTHAPIFD